MKNLNNNEIKLVFGGVGPGESNSNNHRSDNIRQDMVTYVLGIIGFVISLGMCIYSVRRS